MQQQQSQALSKIGQMVAQLEAGEKENASTLHMLHQRVTDPAIQQQLKLLEDREKAAAQSLAQIKSLCGVTGMVATNTKM